MGEGADAPSTPARGSVPRFVVKADKLDRRERKTEAPLLLFTVT